MKNVFFSFHWIWNEKKYERSNFNVIQRPIRFIVSNSQNSQYFFTTWNDFLILYKINCTLHNRTCKENLNITPFLCVPLMDPRYFRNSFVKASPNVFFLFFFLFFIVQLQTVANLGNYWWKEFPNMPIKLVRLPLKIIKPKVCDC